MIQFLLLFVAITWIYYSLWKPLRNSTQRESTFDFNAKLDELTRRIELLNQGREFDQMLIQDAHNQVTRAKAAVAQLLSSHGCSDREIEEIMNLIDGEKR